MTLPTPSTESLRAFAEAAALGSFSAAARKLARSQSTISEAIANLEIDLGVALFDRRARQPQLTEAGRLLLAQAREVLAAQERLARTAGALSAGLESRLTLVVSDTYQSPRYEAMLAELDRRYPELEFECLISEGADVLALLQQGRAQLGLLASQRQYPPDIGVASAAEATEMGLFVAATHALAGQRQVTRRELSCHRELRLNTFVEQEEPVVTGRCWSAPSYLLLLEMAEQGFGWAPLPRWLVERFGTRPLVELDAPGWPRRSAVDVVWCAAQPLGVAGHWVLQRLAAGLPDTGAPPAPLL
ncbi:MAG TPA: LysR family transcriptional regulator [Ideonella sp.]|nr:LysR family transcriptional regulator [Ideonella sp.]